MAEGPEGEKQEGTGKEMKYADHPALVGINLTDPTYQGFYNHHTTPSHPADLPSVLSRAAATGVRKFMVTGSDLAQSQQAIDLAKRYPGRCYATVGVHPCAANSFEEEDEGGGEGNGEALLAALETVAREGVRGGRVVAFGEIGVDFDRLGLAGREVQERWFGRQVEVAVKLQLPLFLHSRAAHESFLRILTPHLPSLPLRGLVHSFTGTLPEMQELVALGFHIGINGCSLKTAENLAVVQAVPLAHLQLETDGPWCEIRPSHAGFKVLEARGGDAGRWKKVKKEKWEEGRMVKGRNEPCEIWKVARVVAGVKGVGVEEVVEWAWRNSVGMFGLGLGGEEEEEAESR
ncbi:MAG: hypothetical protein L6R36_001328 [Xanthoria steineri]|nr:MAG: hypothetical protein L6R36_001328 [Xanthoria steineri]